MDGTAVLAAIWSPLITYPKKQGQAQMPYSIYQPGEDRKLYIGLPRGPSCPRGPGHASWTGSGDKGWGSKVQKSLRKTTWTLYETNPLSVPDSLSQNTQVVGTLVAHSQAHLRDV